jgi:nucleoside-diphosphate-sugar epimerase
MRIALTGVSGFIGSHTARHLHAAGHTVTGLVRPTSRRDHVEAFVDHFVVGEQHDESCWPELLDGADCLIHNSVDREPFRGADTPEAFDHHLQSNLVGSLRLLRFSRPRQFIFVSTLAVHHDMRPRWNGLIDEDHPLRPATDYGAYKAAVEAHLWAEHYSTGGFEKGGRNTSAVRPCAVYGIAPTLSDSRGYDILKSLKPGEPFNRPGGGKYVHVEDVAAVITALVGHPGAAGQVYNLADCYARHADWAKLAAEVLNLEPPPDIDFSSPPKPQNMFKKDAVRTLSINLDRGHLGIKQHLRELARAMGAAGQER